MLISCELNIFCFLCFLGSLDFIPEEVSLKLNLDTAPKRRRKNKTKETTENTAISTIINTSLNNSQVSEIGKVLLSSSLTR